jgi:putative transposase
MPLQQTLKDLNYAYQRAFDPSISVRFPRLKRRSRGLGIRFPQGFKLNGKTVYLPKIGWIGYRKSRPVQGTCKNVVVTFDAGQWYVSFRTERHVPDPVHRSNSAVGIDLGVVRFAALSDGTFVEGANAFKRYGKRISILTRRMSRKRKFSANWTKARAKLGRLFRRVANTRKDMLHKASTTISKNHAIVVLEDLRVSNMAASARGTVENPGAKVGAKTALNRRILDQGWSEFARQLQYKLEWNGGALIRINPANTSRTCSRCGYLSCENRQTQAAFECTACGFAAHADTNAAVNILRRAGQARIACGDSPLGGSANQAAQLLA